jgi:hypothetical protein
MTVILSALNTRPISPPDGIFHIRPTWDVYRILGEAELFENSVVVFWPGTYDLRGTFEFRNIGKIMGWGSKQTRFRRYGQTLFKGVWPYATMDRSPHIGGFSIQNKVSTSEPAIELGGQQNIHIEDIYSWDAPADVLCFTNMDPVDNPPLGHPFGTWTENITLERIVIYGPKSAGIRFRVTDPQRRFQSFSNFRGNGQLTLTQPGSNGIFCEDHVLIYGGYFGFKFNLDDQANGQAVCFGVGPDCNIVSNEWNSFVEGRGFRVSLRPSSRITGHGRFTRQNPAHTADNISAGSTWDGKPSGYVEDGILEDQWLP